MISYFLAYSPNYNTFSLIISYILNTIYCVTPRPSELLPQISSKLLPQTLSMLFPFTPSTALLLDHLSYSLKHHLRHSFMHGISHPLHGPCKVISLLSTLSLPIFSSVCITKDANPRPPPPPPPLTPTLDMYEASIKTVRRSELCMWRNNVYNTIFKSLANVCWSLFFDLMRSGGKGEGVKARSEIWSVR